MFESFVHPALAFGAALAAVPLIIHLLNRQRHKPMQWAAMRFVLAAYRKTRRRVQLENLLLLLLRMAAVALLAFAVARPFATGDSPLAALTEDRRDVILVLDGSASTGYREDVDTVFERIVERASEIASGLDGTRGDRAWLIWAGDHPRLLSWTSPDKALSVLSNMSRPLDEGLDLAAALGEVKGIVEKDAAGTGKSALEVRR
jgi:Ser/Thr protein kinase RdoA (MazF antagonist)